MILFKKTELKSYVYDFSTHYSAIDVDNTKSIHKYLLKKNGIVQKNVQIY